MHTEANVREIVGLTQRLMSYQTTTDNVETLDTMANSVAKTLPTASNPRIYRNNDYPIVFASFVDNPKIILSAHADVVPDSDFGYIPAQLSDNRLIGTGSLDMKSALACFIYLMNHYNNQPTKPSLGLLVSSDEETGSQQSAAYALREPLKHLDADLAIVGEPTNLNLGYRERGTLWLEVSTEGRSAHGGMPSIGENALFKLVMNTMHLKQRYDIASPDTPFASSLNLGIGYAGKQVNRVPSFAKGRLDFRYTTEEEKRSFLRELEQYGFKIEKVLLDLPVSQTDTSQELVRELALAITKEGCQPTYLSPSYFSDGKHFLANGINAIDFGLKGADAHSKDEFLDITSILPYLNILSRLIESA